MTEQTTPTPGPSKKQITEYVTQLFDGDLENLPIEEFLKVDAVAFSKEVLKQKKKNGWQSRIKIPFNYAIDQGEAVVKKVEEVREKVTGAVFDDFWNCFEASLDISVWGSDTWAPRVLPNGAVLIRNHHRVIALSDRIEGVLDVDNTQMQKDLVELFDFYKSSAEEEQIEYFNLNIIHRDENGVSWTVNVPTKLSDYGQTLIFISADFIQQAKDSGSISEDSFIFNEDLERVASNSRTHCVILVFRNKSFLYSTYRAGDEYDTILENYSYWLGSQPDEETCSERFSSKGDFVANYIRSNIEANDIELLDVQFLKYGHNTLKMFMRDKVVNEYSSKKAQQMAGFEPIFSTSPDIPSTYYNDDIPFWEFSQKYQERTFSFQGAYSFLPNLQYGESTLKEAIKNSVSLIGDCTVKVWLPLGENPERGWIDEDDIFDYGTPEYDKRIHEMFKKLTTLYKESAEENDMSEEEKEKDFIDNVGYDYAFAILFITQETLDPEMAHYHAMKMSTYIEGSTSLTLPAYGLYQGYCEGELDTGNAYSLILASVLEASDEDENDDDEYYDEDEDE